MQNKTLFLGEKFGILKKRSYFCSAFRARKVGRVIDRAGLEIRYTHLGIGGLNPSPSAKPKGCVASTHPFFHFPP